MVIHYIMATVIKTEGISRTYQKIGDVNRLQSTIVIMPFSLKPVLKAKGDMILFCERVDGVDTSARLSGNTVGLLV